MYKYVTTLVMCPNFDSRQKDKKIQLHIVRESLTFNWQVKSKHDGELVFYTIHTTEDIQQDIENLCDRMRKVNHYIPELEYIGIDTRIHKKKSSMIAGEAMARFKLFKEIYNDLEINLCSLQEISSYITIFQDILHRMLQVHSQEYLYDEILDVSTYLDLIINQYAKREASVE